MLIRKHYKNFDKNFDKKTFSLKHVKTYELAELYAPSSGTWLIVWYNINPRTNELERVRKTFDINRIQDLALRRAAANNIITIINLALKSGVNFIELAQQQETDIENMDVDLGRVDSTIVNNPQTTTSPEKEDSAPEIKLLLAIEKAFDLKTFGLSKTSVDSARSLKNVFTDWITEEKLHDLSVTQFTELHYRDFLKKRADDGKGKRNINNHITFEKSIFEFCKKPLKYITENPIEDVKHLKKIGSNLYRALTPEELVLVAEKLIKAEPHYFLYTQFIYYEFMRPYHIRAIQRWQLDFENETVIIRGENTKNGKNATKQMMNDMKVALLALGIDKLPSHYYVFGKDFTPSEIIYNTLHKRAAERWRQHIILDLGIDKKMYGLKSTGGQQYLNTNTHIDSGWLQRQMEHSTLSETEAYIAARIAKKIDETQTNITKYQKVL